MWTLFTKPGSLKPLTILSLVVLIASGCASKPEVEQDGAVSRYAAQKEGGEAGASDADHVPAVPYDPAVVDDAKAAFPAYAQGLQQKAAGELEKALATFTSISEQYPALSGPFVNQGLILLELERYEEAEKVLEDAVKTNAKNPYAHNALGLARREVGAFEAALTSYQTALTLDPKYARAHFNLGVLAELYMQDLPLALKHFQRYQALQRNPDDNVANWIIDLERRVPEKDRLPHDEPSAQPQQNNNETEASP